MATGVKHLSRQVRQLSHRSQCPTTRHWHATPRASPFRTFSSNSIRRAEGDKNEASTDAAAEAGSDSAPYFNRAFFKQLTRDDQAEYRTLDPEDRRKAEQVKQALDEEFARDSRSNNDLENTISRYAYDIEQEFPDPPQERERINHGFFSMGEREDLGPDDVFNEDDITSDAHRELEQVREIREYARLAGWEMPLLANMQVPFEPPTKATPLRFRYTTYMGENHPASRKVVVELNPNDLDLTPPQLSKLIKLAGPRFNPQTSVVKMSCESFETQAQNKRYLGDTINALIASAKDTTDSFDDVPYDFRHVKQKRRLQFPAEWLVTEERKKALEDRRQAAFLKEEERSQQGLLVSGTEAIEEGRRIDLERVEEPVMVEARAKLAGGKMGKKQMGQKGR